MKILVFIIFSSLYITGCFSNPTSDNGNENAKLNLIWQYAYNPDGGAPRVKPLIHGNMIITSGDKNVTSIDYATGEMIWKTPFENHRQLMNSSFGLNGNVLVGSISRATIAWDVFSGEKRWAIEFDDTLSFNNSRGVGIIPNGFIAVSNRSYLYKIFTDGTMNIVDTDARSYEMYYDNGIIYAGQVKNMEGMVSAYDVNTFELLWRFNPGGLAYPAYTAPIVENSIVYIGTTAGPTDSQNSYFALNAQTGQEIWRREGIFTYSAVLVGDYIYVNDAAGIYKLRKSDGGIEWYSDFEAGAGTGPIAYGYGYLYAPHSGTMHIVNAQYGEIVHRMSPPHGNWFWLVTAANGRIFAQSSSHLYAFAPWGHKQPLEE